MTKLTDKNHWNKLHKNMHSKKKHNSKTEKIKLIFKRILGRRLIEYTKSYPKYKLWNCLFAKHLKLKKGLKVVEIGSAPGHFITSFSNVYSSEPYGIEYSDSGVELNRKVFSENNYDPDNVIKSDFFNEVLHTKYHEHFDIVISRGFIEHFDNPEEVIEKHINLLKANGYLIVSIPTFEGVNYLISKLAYGGIYKGHNPNIMKAKSFNQAFFKIENIDIQYCGYYGCIDFKLYTTRKKFPLNIAMKILHFLQPFVNILLRCVFRCNGPECKMLSPYLICVARKKS